MPKLSPLQRRLVRRRSKGASPEPGIGGELNVVPFLDIVVNLIMFLLVATLSVLTVSQVQAALPAHGPPCRGRCPEALDLSVTLTDGGIVIAGSGGLLAPGCESIASGARPTLPRIGAGYDWPGLSACVARVKDRYPSERSVILSADPTVPYEELVRAMDATRGDGERLLFPDVRISVGVR